MGQTKRSPDLAKGRRRLAGLGAAAAERHIFMCCDTGERGCAGAKRMRRAWKRLGERLAEAKLERGGRVLRTRSRCFGICAGGPILVVYPDGVWYGGCDPEAIDRIVTEHLLEGRIVDDHLLHRPEPR